MIDEPDDTLAGYVPGKARGSLRVSTQNGIVATVTLPKAPEPEPTRYALALRRQASNRARRLKGDPVLPSIAAGSCSRCEGWGVLGSTRQRCPECGGRG